MNEIDGSDRTSRRSSIRDRLVKTLIGVKVDAAQLVGKGVGSLAPAANNSADSGRMKIQRVELLVQ